MNLRSYHRINYRMFSSRNRRALSLVELLVVLVILSILASLVLPSFRNVMTERKTSMAALEVKSFLEAARARAVAKRRPVSVILERLSSRSDGFAMNPATAIVYPGNPLRSVTAMNAPATSSDNYSQYNGCVRMMMAESPTAVTFDLNVVRLNDIDYSGNPTPVQPAYTTNFCDGNDLPPRSGNADPEPGKLFAIADRDFRLYDLLIAGNEIEFLQNDTSIGKFLITAPFDPADHKAVSHTATSVINIAIQNEGSSEYRFGSQSDVDRMSSQQQALKTYVAVPDTMTRFRVHPKPRPISSLVQELPKGSCIDLSLSGLANDDRNINLTTSPVSTQTFRDCQRQFASDWILPPASGVPLPWQLRPVTITFSGNGSLESISSNAPSNFIASRIEPINDVFLFVGRIDQIAQPLNTVASPVQLDALGISINDLNSIKQNFLDPTGYWVRIGANTPSISASPAQASHIMDDMLEARSGGSADTIGEMLTESRALNYSGELSSQ